MSKRLLKALAVVICLSALPALAVVPDGLITSKTKLALWTTAGVRSTSVHVDTNEGIVTLYGKVPTADQKALAEKLAREINGVRDVKSLLQVVAEAREKQVDRSDKEVMEQAQKQLKADPSLNDSKISVKSVDKGVVLLAGEAKTFSDHLRAVAIVDRVAGVRRVASEVKGPEGFGEDERVTFLVPPKAAAEPHRTGSDLGISTAVKLRLLTAEQIPSTEISVDSENHVVTLFGIVPTAEVKNAAATEAGKVAGVTRVQNELEVVPSSQKKTVEAKDDDITRDLALALKDRPEYKGINTSVKNGSVQLTGTINSRWDEIAAVRLVRHVSGVRSVDDRLKLDTKPDETRRY